MKNVIHGVLKNHMIKVHTVKLESRYFKSKECSKIFEKIY